eukprot:scaffold13260_cov163-Amphora_coffeaeformis.AAC.1
MGPRACFSRCASTLLSYQYHPCRIRVLSIFTILFSFMMMNMILLSRGSVRAASWISHHHHRKSRQLTTRWFTVPTRQETQHQSTTTTLAYSMDKHYLSKRAFLSSTTLLEATSLSSSSSSSSWNTGDKVWIQPQQDDQPRQAAVIQEFRGRGWYSVQLVNDKDNNNHDKDDATSLGIIKIRGTRLEARQNGGNNESVEIDEEKGDTPSETTMKNEKQAPVSSSSSVSQKPTSAAWQDNLPIVDSSTMFRGLAPAVTTRTNATDASGAATTPSIVGDESTALLNTTATSPTQEIDNIPQIGASTPNVFQSLASTMNGPVGLEPLLPTILDLDTAINVQRQQRGNQQEDDGENSLDAEYLRQVAHHAQMEQWVVFTDLHVGPSTLTTCLQVLDFVHQQAVVRNAGVVFLGDFWHQRGTLRVDCLHAVLQALSTWQVPMIMIPGNHDQVTLGGHLHGLTALRNAYRVGDVPGPLIFSHPTVFRQALWIPHIREHAIMESVLQSSAATAENTQAVLCHADITGAFMNDLLVSTGGVPPRWFPSGIPIYSGHFHKPHMVEHKTKYIEYLGSPYQVSLAEAQQSKALAVMDEKWRIIERIPIQIGRFHFRPKSVEDFLQLQHSESRHEENVCCLGDRVVFSVNKLELEQLRREADADKEPAA